MKAIVKIASTTSFKPLISASRNPKKKVKKSLARLRNLRQNKGRLYKFIIGSLSTSPFLLPIMNAHFPMTYVLGASSFGFMNLLQLFNNNNNNNMKEGVGM